MTTRPEVVRQSELMNQLVLRRSTMEPLGRIEVMWMYPPAHRVFGFVCKMGFFSNRKLAFKLSQVEAIGTDGILTHAQPDETDADRVRQLETLIQCEVWSQAGQKLGKIIDYVFCLQTGAITDYLVVGDRLSTLTRDIYRLPPTKIISLGRQRVLVNETTLHQLEPYQAGIRHKLAKVSTVLKDEYEDVTDELRSLAKRAQITTQETTEQLKTLAEQAKERAQRLAEQATERARELSDEWLETLQTLDESDPDHRDGSDNGSDDFLFDWEDDPPTGTPAPQRQPIPHPTAPVQPVAPVQRSTPQPPVSVPPTTPDPTGEEDVWVIGDDLILQRPPAIANTASPANQQPQTHQTQDESAWELEVDPWDITEPPNHKTVPTPPADPDVQADSIESETIPSENFTGTKNNDLDQPWI